MRLGRAYKHTMDWRMSVYVFSRVQGSLPTGPSVVLIRRNVDRRTPEAVHRLEVPIRSDIGVEDVKAMVACLVSKFETIPGS
jgi:hypothetical protein